MFNWLQFHYRNKDFVVLLFLSSFTNIITTNPEYVVELLFGFYAVLT